MINSAQQSISSMAIAIHFSERNGISTWCEPDDRLDNYIDFLDELSYDWINDDYLHQLCEKVFERKGTESDKEESN